MLEWHCPESDQILNGLYHDCNLHPNNLQLLDHNTYILPWNPKISLFISKTTVFSNAMAFSSRRIRGYDADFWVLWMKWKMRTPEVNTKDLLATVREGWFVCWSNWIRSWDRCKEKPMPWEWLKLRYAWEKYKSTLYQVFIKCKFNLWVLVSNDSRTN